MRNAWIILWGYAPTVALYNTLTILLVEIIENPGESFLVKEFFHRRLGQFRIWEKCSIEEALTTVMGGQGKNQKLKLLLLQETNMGTGHETILATVTCLIVHTTLTGKTIWFIWRWSTDNLQIGSYLCILCICFNLSTKGQTSFKKNPTCHGLIKIDWVVPNSVE